MSDLDNLLDSTLDDLEDLPEFKPFAPGTHKVLASFEQKDINGKPAVELNLEMVETIELVNSAEEPPKQGDKSNTMFMLDNEFGRGALKKAAIPLGEALGTGVLREIIEQTKGIECLVVTSLRKDKNDPDKQYLQVKEIAVI